MSTLQVSGLILGRGHLARVLRIQQDDEGGSCQEQNSARCQPPTVTCHLVRNFSVKNGLEQTLSPGATAKEENAQLTLPVLSVREQREPPGRRRQKQKRWNSPTSRVAGSELGDGVSNLVQCPSRAETGPHGSLQV
jgi:hypothetical protein